jgi:hypothetical protein
MDLSPTRQQLDAKQIARLVRAAFGDAVHVVDSAPLTGGGFASVIRVTLSDGREVVLKVGPPPGTALLEYEAGMIAAEARYLRLAGPSALPGSPLPQLYAAGGGQSGADGPANESGAVGGGKQGSEWMIMTLLPGVSLAGLDGAARSAPRVREQLGAAIARMHTVLSPTGRFGYEGERAHGATWGEAFAAIIDALLRDARRWQVRLPVPEEEISALVAEHRGELDRVTRASLLHFDLWDENVLCSPAPSPPPTPGPDTGELELTGLVDGERYLFGDPLLDFVSPALFHRIEDASAFAGGHPFARGYGRSTSFTADEVRRLTLYRMHLYLLMVVEMPSRKMVGPRFAERAGSLSDLLAGEVKQLRG